MYSPTTSRTFSVKNGSADSLNDSRRWGLRPNARQMRPTAVWDRPRSRARVRVLQWVASFGVASRVRARARSTWASVTVLGAPGRGSSVNPSRRASANRDRHLRTVGRVRWRSAAMAALDCPAAAARTIRARVANRCWVVGRFAQVSSLSRSSSVRAIG